jgi:hypothetical protein
LDRALCLASVLGSFATISTADSSTEPLNSLGRPGYLGGAICGECWIHRRSVVRAGSKTLGI